jgi:TonB family protein
MIRSVDGNFSDAIINPLIGLGINYQQRGDPLQAMAIFEEARTVNRRVHGLMNEDQIDILDHMSNVMIDMQRYAEADRLQVDALQLRERIYGAESMEILPAIYKFAQWLRAAYRFQEERDQYSRAMGIIRDNDMESSPAMIRALRETGNSFRVQKYPEGRGISALRRALEIAEDQEQPDTLTVAELLVDIGDWNTAFSKVGPTGDEYRRAWALLGELANGDEIRHRWFNDPDYVLRENPSNRGLQNSSEPGVLPGHVLVTFDVEASGRTTNVQVVESVPVGLKDDSTARAINRSRFRPRIVDGELVASTGHARNFTFYYLPQTADE